jgi:2-hydroxy-3-oxopropionate reductase
MVPDSPDVEQVLEGPDGVFTSLQRGTIIIDCSSIAPATAKRLAERAAALGGTMLDAPVSGGDIGAIQGTLSIMVGGDAQAFATVKPILDIMGNPERVVHIGEAGAGQLCKLCNQMVIGGTLAVVAEAFALAKKAGVDASRVREALLGGFASSRVLEVHGNRLLQGTYKPGFKTDLFAKDLRNVVATLAEHDVPAPVSAIVQQLVHATMAKGPCEGRQLDHGQDSSRARGRRMTVSRTIKVRAAQSGCCSLLNLTEAARTFMVRASSRLKFPVFQS